MSVKLPHFLLERIYLQSLELSMQDFMQNELLSIQPHDSSVQLIRYACRQLAQISQVNRDSLESCQSEYFSRQMAELLFPFVSFSPNLEHECKIEDTWSHWSKRAFIKAVISHEQSDNLKSFKFIWNALKKLAIKQLELNMKYANVSWGQVPDALAVWRKPDTLGSGDWCMRFTCFGSVLLLSSHIENWILLEPAHMAMIRSERDDADETVEMQGCIAPQNTPVLSNMNSSKIMEFRMKYSSAASIEWRPPQRYYVFEDLVTLSSHMESLICLDSSNNTISGLTYGKCGICHERYPECGKALGKQMCGSCLYTMDLHMFKLNI